MGLFGDILDNEQKACCLLGDFLIYGIEAMGDVLEALPAASAMQPPILPSGWPPLDRLDEFFSGPMRSVSIRETWLAIKSLASDNLPANKVQVVGRLIKTGRIDEVGLAFLIYCEDESRKTLASLGFDGDWALLVH